MTEIHKKKLIDLINSYQTWPEKRNAIFGYIEKEIEQPLWNAAREDVTEFTGSGFVPVGWKYPSLTDYNNKKSEV